jgi:hypothetical protein
LLTRHGTYRISPSDWKDCLEEIISNIWFVISSGNHVCSNKRGSAKVAPHAGAISIEIVAAQKEYIVDKKMRKQIGYTRTGLSGNGACFSGMVPAKHEVEKGGREPDI